MLASRRQEEFWRNETCWLSLITCRKDKKPEIAISAAIKALIDTK